MAGKEQKIFNVSREVPIHSKMTRYGPRAGAIFATFGVLFPLSEASAAYFAKVKINSTTLRVKMETVPVTVVTPKITAPSATPSPAPTPSPSQTPFQAPAEAKVRLFVLVPMTLSESFVSLMHQSAVVATSENKPVDFSLRLELTGKTTEFTLNKIDAKGTLQAIPGVVELEDWDSVMGGKKEKPWHITPSLGLAFYSYSESTISLSILGILFKVSGGYRFKNKLERFEAIGGGSITALPFYNSDSTRTTRFMSLYAKAVYHSPWLKGPWALNLSGGYQYTTMIVSPADHGFGYMSSLLLYPSVTHQFSKGVGRAYVKYAPIFGIALGNREIGFGFGYDLPLKNEKTVAIDLDVSNIGFTSTDNAGATRTTNTWAIGLTGGYRF